MQQTLGSLQATLLMHHLEEVICVVLAMSLGLLIHLEHCLVELLLQWGRHPHPPVDVLCPIGPSAHLTVPRRAPVPIRCIKYRSSGPSNSCTPSGHDWLP